MKSDNVKDTILIEVEKMVREDGIMSLNMRNVAKRCKIAIGTVYYYYPSKSDLIFELMRVLLDNCCKNIDTEYKGDLFKELKGFYFAIKDYLKGFSGNLMNELLSMAKSEKNEGFVENSHMGIFNSYIENILTTYKDCISKELLDRFTIEQIAGFVLMNFTSCLRSNSSYDFLEYILPEILT